MFILMVILTGCSAIIQMLMSRLNENIQRARRNERDYFEENRKLNLLQSSLEQRIQERTAELETANRNNLRRARQFEAVAQAASAISNIQNLELLLPQITKVISQQFGHYHTGIFLLDPARQYAVLRAANSAGGQRMMDREHKLRVGQTGIVGYVTASGLPRIALNVGEDAVFFDNPDLPTTRSEIALPLRISGEIVGALDVQSEEENAFKPDDISALLTLADQVAIAIQNTRTIDQARKSLAEAQSAHAESVQQAWKILQPQSSRLGLQWIGSTIKHTEKPVDERALKKVLEAGKTVLPPGRVGDLTLPVRLRGKVIGVLNLRNNDHRLWSDDEVDLVEAIAERLSLAIESASLLRSAQNRAEIERMTTEITAKIGSSTRFDTILQTAAEELSLALGGTDVLVQIDPYAFNPEGRE
jgi:GAF domain-containing protein